MTQTLHATVADGTRFAGTWKGRDLTVLGAFEGSLELSGRLRLGPSARLTGAVRAAAVEIEGEFDGEVRAESLVFGAQARARGVFLAPRLTIHEGACVDGALNLEPPARSRGDKGRAARDTAAPDAAADAAPNATAADAEALPA
jgi:cytoskeletal protein CcmA (bactofilin family)